MSVPERSTNNLSSPTGLSSDSGNISFPRSPCDSLFTNGGSEEDQVTKRYLERMRVHESYAAQYCPGNGNGGKNGSSLCFLPTSNTPPNGDPSLSSQQAREELEDNLAFMGPPPSANPYLLPSYTAPTAEPPSTQQKDQSSTLRQLNSNLNSDVAAPHQPGSAASSARSSTQGQQASILDCKTGATVQPGITATSSSFGISGYAPTRPPSTPRSSSCQQRPQQADTIASTMLKLSQIERSLTENNSDATVTEEVMTNYHYGSTSKRSSISTSTSDQSGVQLNMAEPIKSPYQPLPLFGSFTAFKGAPASTDTAKATPIQYRNTDAGLSSVPHQMMQLHQGMVPFKSYGEPNHQNPAGTVFRDGLSIPSLNHDLALLQRNNPIGTKKINSAPSAFTPFIGPTTEHPSYLTEQPSNEISISREESLRNSGALYTDRLMDGERSAYFGVPVVRSGDRASIVSNPYSHEAGSEAHWQEKYFNPRGRSARQVDPYIQPDLPPRREERSVDYQKSSEMYKPFCLDSRRSRGWIDGIQSPITDHYTREMTFPFMPANSGGGIDHYHGSPHQQPQYTPSARSFSTGGAIGNASGMHRPRHGSVGQRCGLDCHTLRTQLASAKEQIEILELHVKQYYSQAMKYYNQLGALREQERSQQRQIAPPAMSVRASATATDNEIRLNEQCSRLHLSEPGTQQQVTSEIGDEYFKTEFGVYSNSIKCWAERFLKFPTNKPISLELSTEFNMMCGGLDQVHQLLNNDKTKAFTVMALVSRLLDKNIFQSALEENGASFGDLEYYCKRLTDGLINRLMPLMSRQDQIFVAGCRDHLSSITGQAQRLADKLISARGASAWEIYFPKFYEPFQSACMMSMEPDKIGWDLERFQVKLAATPVVTRRAAEAGVVRSEVIQKACVLIYI